MKFTSVSDFEQCMQGGGEAVFEWKGVTYSCFGRILSSHGYKPRMLITPSGNSKAELWCYSTDELLAYMLGEDRLRDVIDQVNVLERSD